MFKVIKNLLWLDLKRLKGEAFRNLLFIGINFSLFFAMTLVNDSKTYVCLFIIVSLANTLFLQSKTSLNLESISLLHSIGSSKSFIRLYQLTEIILLDLISFLCFIPFLFFRPLFQDILFFGGGETIYLICLSLIFTQLTLNRVEHSKKVL